jgi:hypothetical protein
MARRVVPLCVGTVLAAVGCGDDLPAAGDAAVRPDATRAPAGDPYDAPADFERGACVAGSLATLPRAPGVYHVQVDFGGATPTYAVRLDAVGAAGAGQINGTFDLQRAELDADDLCLRSADPASGVRAFDLCAMDPDGTLRGTYARCPGDECFLAPVIGHRVDRLVEPDASGLTLLGEFRGAPGDRWPDLAVNVRVRDDVAYVATYRDGLRIVDVSEPAAPVELAHVPTETGEAGDIWNDVKLIDGPAGTRFALLASSATALVVVDVTTPSAPSVVAHAGTAPAVHTVFVEGQRAYLANLERGLEIYDLAVPTAPVRLGGFQHAGEILHDLWVRGDRAYLSWWDAGMLVVDVSDPTAPTELGAFAGYGETSNHSSAVTRIGDLDVAVTGDEQYGAHVYVVDVTEGAPGFPRQLGQWQTRPEVSVHNLMAIGDRAYLTHYQDGVRVLDLTDPTTPTLVAWFNTWPGYAPTTGANFFEGAVGLDVDLAAGRIYVADTHRGLLLLAIEPAAAR